MFNNLKQQQNQNNVSVSARQDDVNQNKFQTSATEQTAPLTIPSQAPTNSSEQASVQNKIEDIFNETDKVENVLLSNNISKEENISANSQNQNKFFVFIVIIAIMAVILFIGWLIVNKFLDKKSSSIDITAPKQQDLDADIDKFLNLQAEESTQQTKQIQKTDPAQATSSVESSEETQLIKKNIDTDKDGLDDEREKLLGTDIYSMDTDNDGLFDREEVEVYKTDPLNFDTDGDGFLDGDEVKAGYNPKGEGKLYEVK